MRLLADTHVIIWWLTDHEALVDDVKAKLDHEPDVFVSAATIWEVAIKQAIGKLDDPADLPERIMASGFRELPITSRHAAAAGRLPPIHQDPFDRMLVAQAQCEGLTLITKDRHIRKYDVSRLDA